VIYTLTLNPAIDYLVTVPRLVPGETNRCLAESAQWGGRGINVSVVLRNLRVPSVAMGLLAGFTGGAVRRGLKLTGLRTDFTELEAGLTRVNLKIADRDGGLWTEINGAGPPVDAKAAEALMRRLSALVGQDDTLVMAGNIPPSMGQDFYARIMRALSGRGARFVVDASGPALALAIAERPMLVKTNLDRLAELLGAEAGTDGRIAAQARAVLGMGARSVLISLAGRGAMLVGEGAAALKAAPPAGQVVNHSGAGDALLAGFLAGLHGGQGPAGCLRLAAAAGGAAAFSATLPEAPEIEALLDRIGVAELA
jgi:1-phosphofructokinase